MNLLTFWDGTRLHAVTDGGGSVALPESDEPAIPPLFPPLLPDGVTALSLLLWPVEKLLSRPFKLPLPHPRLLDEQILGQELAEQSGEESDHWWLCWQAAAVEGGVAGTIFALPESCRAALAEDRRWSGVQRLLPDIWPRLNSWLPASNYPCAVLDADDEGLFVGLHRQIWRGMRRINRSDDRETLVINIERTLQAMGFESDMPVYGRLDTTLNDLLAERLPQLQVRVRESLPSRAEANLEAAQQTAAVGAPDFRRGSWATSADWGGKVRPWRKAIFLAGLLFLLALGSQMAQVTMLHGEIAKVDEQIAAEFKKALPDQPIVDPLAQLRKAAGDGNQGSGDSWKLLRGMQAVAGLSATLPDLKIVSFDLQQGKVALRGHVRDFTEANKLRETLAQKVGAEVELGNTELVDQEHVRFMVRW